MAGISKPATWQYTADEPGIQGDELYRAAKG